MRILHISTRLILGGSQENTVLSCEEQCRRGAEVHLAFGPIYGPEGSLLERVKQFRTSSGRGIATHEVPSLVREVSPWKDARARGELEALIDRIKPDVIHTHSSKAGILGRLAGWSVGTRASRGGRAADVPAVVHTIHGPPFMPVEGGVFARAKVRALNLAYTLAERKAARRCHAIVSVADAMTREFLRRGIGGPEQYTTVRSGMEVERFLHSAPGEDRASVRAELGLDEDDFVIGTVARLAQHKGHDDLLDALGEDLKLNPRWKLLWVGDGWWKDRLVQKANKMGLAVADRATSKAAKGRGNDEGALPQRASIILTGLVPPERVGACMRAMDVLAHPSMREGLPRTVPQALLCGVCPVAYDVDGTGEACIDMQTGRLVRPGNLPHLRGAIAWCAEHPRARADLAERGRVVCSRAFSVAAMVDGLDSVYAHALDKARRSPQP